MSKRTLMLASTVRDTIAPVLRECPRECGIVTITRIEISSDASYATVYMSALKEPELALEFLRKEGRDLQRQLGKLPRKKIPLLRFRYDDSGERGRRIDELLEEADKQLPHDSSDRAQ